MGGVGADDECGPAGLALAVAAHHPEVVTEAIAGAPAAVGVLPGGADLHAGVLAPIEDQRQPACVGDREIRGVGGPSTPMEVYLRYMFLKFRYRLGYESLCREVTDSIRCRRVLPDPARRAGAASDDVDEAHDPLWYRGGDGCKVVEAKLLLTARLRADTTVVAADVRAAADAENLPPVGRCAQIKASSLGGGDGCTGR